MLCDAFKIVMTGTITGIMLIIDHCQYCNLLCKNPLLHSFTQITVNPDSLVDFKFLCIKNNFFTDIEIFTLLHVKVQKL